MTDRYYQGLKEIRRARSEEEANSLLKQGYELIKPVEVNSPETLTQVHYSMGLFENAKAPPAASSSAPPARAVSIGLILGLPWQPSTLTGVDSWLPANKLPKEVKEFIEKNGTKTPKGTMVQAGNFDVYLSPTSGNLQRYKAK